VNLIGEHTDYNEGFVLPLAVDRRMYVAAAPRDDNSIQVRSFNFAESATFDLDQKLEPSKARWLLYVEGIARSLVEQGFRLKGADITISSEVPMGAGLSSSGALEVCVGFALLKLAGYEVELMKLALAAQRAEHVFVGTESGLMDQLTAAFGTRNHAMLIDCRSLERKMIPLNIPAMAIVVCDTRVKHDLATTAYNQRRRECEQAAAILRKTKPSVRSLRDVTLSDLELYGELLPETLRRRSCHVISENERTLSAAEALINGDVHRLGELMNLSHESLRDDYEVSCPELDIMVELSRQQTGVAGARMMGGGFGGSTVNLVRRNNIDQFRRRVSEDYQRATGLVPAIITVTADDGVREMN
jgi:galactokinase